MNSLQNVGGLFEDSVMLVVFTIGIWVLGLMLKIKFFQAIKSGLLMSISFLGIKMLVLFVCDAFVPVTAYFSGNGGRYQAVDVGWQAFALSSFLLPFGLVCVVGGFLLNIFLIKKRLVKTLNTDIWDYCHILFCGAVAWVVFENVLFSVLICLAVAAITAKCGDWVSKIWQEHTESPGTTGCVAYHLTTMYPVYWICDKVLERIPGVRNIEFSADRLVLKLRPLGDSAVIGLLIGGGLGFFTQQPAAEIIRLAFTVPLFLLLSGRITSLFMEGLSPISAAARKWATTYLGKDSSFLIGMDFSLGQGDPTAIHASVLLMPVGILLALILPGIGFFPTTLLPNLIVYTCVGSLVCRGNLFRVMVGSVVMIIFMLYAQTWLLPLTTSFLQSVGIALPFQATGGSASNIFALVIALIGKIMGKW